MNTMPYLPGLHLPISRRKARSPQKILAEKIQQVRLKSFSQLGECFGRFIPNQYLQPTESGALSRRRLFSKENTFWAFFSQVLDADGGCKEVVRKLQASVAVKLKAAPSSSTAAYCKARKKLELSTLESIHLHLSDQLKANANADCLNGRRIIVVDGTGVSMPDTVNGHNQGARSQAVVFHRQPFVLASTCKMEHCSAMKQVTKKVMSCPCFVSNGTPLKMVMFSWETRVFAAIMTSQT
jgi:hypothetical protein